MKLALLFGVLGVEFVLLGFAYPLAWAALLAVGDSVWNAAITGLVAIGLAWIAYREKARDAKLERIAVVTDANHELSNSAFLANLKTIAELLMDRARHTGKPEDAAMAHEAVAHYETHKKTQDNINKNAIGEKIEPASDLKRRLSQAAGVTTHKEDVIKAGENIKTAGAEIAEAGKDIAKLGANDSTVI